MSKIIVNDMKDRLMEVKAKMLRKGCVNFQYYGMDNYNADVIKSFENLTLEEVLEARYRFILNVGTDGFINGIDMINVFDTVKNTLVEFGLFALHAYDKCEDVFVGKTIDITILASLINAGGYNAYNINVEAENNISTYHIHSRCLEVIDTALKRYENTDNPFADITQAVADYGFTLPNTVEFFNKVFGKEIEIDDGDEEDLTLVDEIQNKIYLMTLNRDGNNIIVKQILCQSK